jgi:thymidylate synthase (FAD)
MPKIYILSRPTFDDEHKTLLKDILPSEDSYWLEYNKVSQAERLVEFAGRICYLSFGKAQSSRTNSEYILNLIRNEHESVLEHAAWTFAFSDVSRGFTHQLVRHRIGFSFSQLSQQYHDESEAPFVKPLGLERSPQALEAWEKAMHHARDAYREILLALDNGSSGKLDKEEKRFVRSVARSVLPNATESTIVVTANARAIRNFLKARGNIMGDLEMRAVCVELFARLLEESPALFQDFTIEKSSDGSLAVVHYSQQAKDG